jgi:tRNA pseudouridine38-40 synthase
MNVTDSSETSLDKMNRYFLKLAFDGTLYHGWQFQKNAETVQDILNKALSLLIPGSGKLTGAGRTDAGVHAREFYAHFDCEEVLDLPVRKKLVFKLNRYLPADIVIHDIIPVKPKANARFSATSRTYKYYLHTFKDPFREKYSQYFYGKLDLELMNEGANILVKTNDFTSFSKVDTDTRTNICMVDSAFWIEDGNKIIFTIRADRFLRNMVRAIVGTLMELGKGKMNLAEFENIIATRNRSDAGESGVAKGLFLEKIEYPEGIFLQDQE